MRDKSVIIDYGEFIRYIREEMKVLISDWEISSLDDKKAVLICLFGAISSRFREFYRKEPILFAKCSYHKCGNIFEVTHRNQKFCPSTEKGKRSLCKIKHDVYWRKMHRCGISKTKEIDPKS